MGSRALPHGMIRVPSSLLLFAPVDDLSSGVPTTDNKGSRRDNRHAVDVSDHTLYKSML